MAGRLVPQFGTQFFFPVVYWIDPYSDFFGHDSKSVPKIAQLYLQYMRLYFYIFKIIPEKNY